MKPARPPLWGRAVAACALLAALALLSGMTGGLARFGLPLPVMPAPVHGALMLCAFFGTLIALERAVALQRLAGLLAPLLAGVGGVLAQVPVLLPLAQVCWAAAAAGLVTLYIYAGVTRAWSLHLLVEAGGAACWLVGVLLWMLHGDLAALTRGGVGFLVLTIAGERRELTQMMRLPPLARRLFVAAVLLIALGVSGVLPFTLWSGCALLAVWLLRWDIAPRAWSAAGWPGHTAQCLTVGYLWLLVGALLGLYGELRVDAGPLAATGLHAVLLGFVFAMVFGHAPIILPALLRLRPAYTGLARLPLWLLAASLALRIVAVGVGRHDALMLAGAGHALAILLFAAVMLRAVSAASHRKEMPA
ncbi:MAG: hypothetical protein NVV69_04320 [Methyloversatilis sp.]|uniref:hypothetical protein n=1 Tax=Methyloversatilis sp. TaxID=2569862 RepID=UPI0025ED7B4E|nr:hypothetical protein [Methyloversatilis sp.]MCR6665238.1 hypothetical protein [Methyloversatilis sp.]